MYVVVRDWERSYVLSFVFLSLRHEISKLRSGRPDKSMFNHIGVEAYGSKQPLPSLGQVVMKSDRQLVVNVYDATVSERVRLRNIRQDGYSLSFSRSYANVYHTQTSHRFLRLIDENTNSIRSCERGSRSEPDHRRKYGDSSHSENDQRDARESCENRATAGRKVQTTHTQNPTRRDFASEEDEDR